MGNDASTAADAQIYSPEEYENQKKDLLGLLSLEQGASDCVKEDTKSSLPKTTRKYPPGDSANEEQEQPKRGNEGKDIQHNNCKTLSSGEDTHCQDTDLAVVKEVSFPDNAKDHVGSFQSEKKGKLLPQQTPGKDSQEETSKDDDGLENDIDENRSADYNEKAISEKKYNRCQSQIFSEASLRGSIEKSNESYVCKDPILEAVATGSAARRAKYERLERVRQHRNFSRARGSFSNDNEWKISLRRLAETAASTAKTVVHATAPVISDAKHVIISSASEFAQDVKDEWEREHERPPENEIILSTSFHDDEPSSKKNFIDDIHGPGRILPLSKQYDSTPLKMDIINQKCIKEFDDDTELISSKTSFGEERKIDGVGKDNDSSLSAKKCIFEELHNMEKEFNTQIQSVLSNSNDGGDGTSDDVTKLKILLAEDDSNTDYDRSERSAEIAFAESTDSDRQSLTTEPSKRQHSKSGRNKASSHEQETISVDEIQTGEEKELDSSIKGEDNDHCVLSSTPKIRTRSGRVVKPVRRLVDGYESSIGGENQYGSSRQQTTDDIEIVTIDRDESVSQTFDATKNLQVESKHEKVSRSDETPLIEEQGIGVTDISSISSAKNQTDDVIQATKESFTKVNGIIDPVRRRKPLSEEVVEKNLPLFGYNDDSLYQSEYKNIATDITSANSAGKPANNAISKLQTEDETFVQNEEGSKFIDRKSIVKFIATKLTGFEVEVRDKVVKVELLDPSSYIDQPVDSVFEKELRSDIDYPSSGSLSSPPEIDEYDQKIDERLQNLSRDEIKNFHPMFDSIPPKSEISMETDTINERKKGQSCVSDEKVKNPTLFKQGSIGSTNDSSGSFSTHQKSSTSLPYRRSNRRLRRQGSRLSITQSSKSPYETPVDNRSLVDGKLQIETNSIDYDGQMVRWDSDIEAKYPSVPDTEEMTEALERSELFHETLAVFLSLENIDFLSDFSPGKALKVPKTLASLMWRQLIANWKHSEACKSMCAWPSSIHAPELTKHSDFVDVEDNSSSVSTIQLRFGDGNVVLPNHFLSADAYSSLRQVSYDGYYDVKVGFLVLTRYLCDIGPDQTFSVGSCNAFNESPLCHDLAISSKSDKDSVALSITEIQREAKTWLKSLERVIDQVVKFSNQNSSSYTDFERNDINSSCGVKDYTSIRNKAERKYDGDISQVKDVLRGQITFPDEGLLICGLCSLHSIAERGGNNGQIGQNEPTFSFQIVRLKNLFRATSVCDKVCHALPTGYRHILINIKFDSGLIAGKSWFKVSI